MPDRHRRTLHSPLSLTAAAGIVVDGVAEVRAIGWIAVAVGAPRSMMTDLIVSGVDRRKVAGAARVSAMIVKPTVTWTRICDLVMPSGMTANHLYEKHPAILEISETLVTPSTATSALASTDKVLWPTSHKPLRRVSRLHHHWLLSPRPLVLRPFAHRPHLTFLLKYHLRHPGPLPKTVKTGLFPRVSLLVINGLRRRARQTLSVLPSPLVRAECSSRSRRARLANSGLTLP